MMQHANSWLLAALIAGCAVMLLAIVLPIWRARGHTAGPDRTELDNTEPLVSVDRVNSNRREP